MIARDCQEARAEETQRKISDMKLTAVFKKVPEGYIGFVEELPGANTQGKTLEEAKANLQEAIAMIMEANRAMASEQVRGIKR